MLLEVFYENNKNKLVSSLASYSGDKEGAKDAVQEAFLRALGRRELFSLMPEKSIWSWLYKTAKNVLTDEKRKTSRLVPYDDFDVVDPAGDPIDTTMVKQLLHTLPDHLIHVVSLRYFGGLNSTEIGRLKGLPPATVRSQLRAAISILKRNI